MIFDIYGYIFIESPYFILVKKVIISFLKIYIINKEYF